MSYPNGEKEGKTKGERKGETGKSVKKCYQKNIDNKVHMNYLHEIRTFFAFTYMTMKISIEWKRISSNISFTENRQ